MSLCVPCCHWFSPWPPFFFLVQIFCEGSIICKTRSSSNRNRSRWTLFYWRWDWFTDGLEMVGRIQAYILLRNIPSLYGSNLFFFNEACASSLPSEDYAVDIYNIIIWMLQLIFILDQFRRLYSQFDVSWFNVSAFL